MVGWLILVGYLVGVYPAFRSTRRRGFNWTERECPNLVKTEAQRRAEWNDDGLVFLAILVAAFWPFAVPFTWLLFADWKRFHSDPPPRRVQR